MFKNILVPTDGTAFAEKAIGAAVELAKAIGAKVTGVTVIPPMHALDVDGILISDTLEDYDMWAMNVTETRLAAIAKPAAAAGVPVDVLRIDSDDAADGIIRAAVQGNCDLILMASHGRRGMSALLLGSETQKVLTHGKIPVLVVR
jgi:nucleotide-binding universal stress UspA family protein